ncbi:hypothetical protein [uncultured Ralstonia sp.]|jgi:hypothetical protein|uniref:hypothetical protein n=1 Tax=Ralstonia sp. TaxID=54061 RepID=UPI001EA4DA02|nr:hypothetical protein [uncultured Ralstonia sp.]UCF24340.1 MAG: hypothetical protein JSV72_02300 [Ralstonia sp.]
MSAANPSPSSSNPSEPPAYWFRAKRYGWGWGLPVRWQGWLVFVGYFILLIAGVIILRPAHAPILFVAYTMALSLLLVLVCWWKGEPPRWRWRED